MSTFALMRRDPAWRYLPVAALVGLAALALRFESPALRGGAAGIISGLYLGFLGSARIHVRASAFEAALPIDGRDLIRARIFSLLLFIWLPVLVATTVALQFGPNAALGLTWPLSSAAMAASAAVIFLQLYGLPGVAAANSVALGTWLTLVAASIGVAYLVRKSSDVTPAMITLAVAALLIAAFAVVTWPRYPLALQLAPLELREVGTTASTSADPGSWSVLWRSLFTWRTAIWFSFSAVYPLIDNFMLPLFFVPGYLTGTYSAIRWMFPLPVSRRRLLAIVALPYLVVYGSSLFINLTWGIGSDADQALDPRPTGLRLASPWWKHVSANEVPLVQAPWGEAHSPEIKRVWLIRSYNPFESGADNSLQFKDWQFRRATRTVFGEEIALAYRARLNHLRPLSRRPVGNLLNVAALLFIVMVLMSICLLPRWSRLSHLPPALRKYGAIALALPLVLTLALSPLLAKPGGNFATFDLFAMAWADTVRANPVAAWSTILLVLWLLYRFLEKQFSELEPDNQPISNCGRSPFKGGLFG
ncbi:MAG: hypothetical protein EBY17_16175 [Acidobacteriia bacterium]|nr:hypothetical protein [Terriglobia bacterium]